MKDMDVDKDRDRNMESLKKELYLNLLQKRRYYYRNVKGVDEQDLFNHIISYEDSSYFFEDCQNVRILLNNNITKLHFYNCKNIELMMGQFKIYAGLDIHQCENILVKQNIPLLVQIDCSKYINFTNINHSWNNRETWILVFNCYKVRHGNDCLPITMFDHGKLIHLVKQKGVCCTQSLERCLPTMERVTGSSLGSRTLFRLGNQIPILNCLSVEDSSISSLSDDG